MKKSTFELLGLCLVLTAAFSCPAIVSAKTSTEWISLFDGRTLAGWKAGGSKRIDQLATDRLSQRLAAYEKPSIDPEVEIKLSNYIASRKKKV